MSTTLEKATFPDLGREQCIALTTLAAYRTAHPGASAGGLLAAIQTDWWWRIPAIRLADAHAKSPSATYM